MSAIDVSVSRGRSRTPRSRSGSVQRRRIMSRSLSSASRASRNNLYRTYAISSTWKQKIPDPFPSVTKAIFRYSTNVALNPGIGAAASYVFRATSIFDPDFSGVGHQPYGHDVYQQMYKRYRVDKAFITATNTNKANNSIMGITLRSSTSTVSDIEQIREVKATKYTALATTNQPMKVMQSYDKNWSPEADSADLSAQMGANPTTNNYFHVWATGNSTSDPSALEVAVDIVYVCTLWEPLLQAIS